MLLGELIARLEAVKADDDGSCAVSFDFCNVEPNGKVDSYRGYYNQLALGWRDGGRGRDYKTYKEVTRDELVATLKSAISATFCGWKGGDFVMSENTQVWVDNPGEATGTGIVGVISPWPGRAVILTARMD